MIQHEKNDVAVDFCHGLYVFYVYIYTLNLFISDPFICNKEGKSFTFFNKTTVTMQSVCLSSSLWR